MQLMFFLFYQPLSKAYLSPAAWGPEAERPCAAVGCAHWQHTCTGAWFVLEQRQWLMHRQHADPGSVWLSIVKKKSNNWQQKSKKKHGFYKLRHSRIRWEAIMRGTWVFPVAVGRMVFKACGLGADGRIAPGMLWKSG